DSGLFSMLLPASLGGAELDVPSFARAVEELARADASVAWCIGQANGLSAYMAYIDPTAAHDVFNATSRTILANGPGEGNRPRSDSGLFSMLLPASLGGAELDVPSFARAVEELARADASVAWCIGQANGLSAYMAYIDPTAAHDVFNATSRTILANGPGEGNRP